MRLPTAVAIDPVGGGEGDAPGRVVALSTPVESMRFCFVCELEEVFIAGWTCDTGLLGCCLGCGDERIIPFTRTNSEAA